MSGSSLQRITATARATATATVGLPSGTEYVAVLGSLGILHVTARGAVR